MNHRRADPIVLGPRVPVVQPLVGRMEAMMNIGVPNRVVEPRGASETTSSAATATSTKCPPGDNSSLCEKPVGSNSYTLPIILGVAIPLVGAFVVFLYLHRRHVRKMREEDANDPNARLDFGLGLGNVRQGGRKKGPPPPLSDVRDYGEKGGRQRLVSMDLSMNSPYLLPPELHQSSESIHSLSRSIHQHEDPYNPINQYYAGDGASIRSLSRMNHEASSTYTGSSKAQSRFQEVSSNSDAASSAGSMTKLNTRGGPFVPPSGQNLLPRRNEQAAEAKMTPPPPPYPVEPQQAHIEDSTLPRSGLPVSGLPMNPRPGQNLSTRMPKEPESSENHDESFQANNNYLGSFINGRDAPPPPTIAPRMSPPMLNSLPANPRPPRKESVPVGTAVAEPVPQHVIDDESDYGNGFQVTPPSPVTNHAELMRSQRYSMDVPPEEFAQAGLGAPNFDPRRLSMGFRPLPPDLATESDDPEVRANRIRSFYKEYFDETKPAPAGQYYEDYDQTYLGNDTAYYDPTANSFVRPYAEPVTRRAMTPPPRGPPRFQGQGQFRGRQGSIGAMSTGGMSQGGGYGSQMYPPAPFIPGPRAYSSASGRSAGSSASRRPPPAALPTLPTPSKLKDDSFALMNAMDFAPPQTYRDRAAGRSESPLGERRPYSPAVPSFIPTASAYEELAPMPSPHLLRKSGTFTGLDFAPPRKFREADTMSDAGSIRSNRSGVSARTQGAIRTGAYRVSRLPQDMVPTRDDMAFSLKPQWGMRPNAS